MKKRKLIPSLLVLLLCVAVLGVGIYAARPASNRISGTVTINAANAQVEITAFLDEVVVSDPDAEPAVEGTEISNTVVTRTSHDIVIQENKIVFDTDDAEAASNVAAKTIIFQIKNNSDKALGVYFSLAPITTALTTSNAAATVAREMDLNGIKTADSTVLTDAVHAQMSGYVQLAGNATITTVTVRLTLNNLYTDDYTVDLENSIYLNIELYNADVATALA